MMALNGEAGLEGLLKLLSMFICLDDLSTKLKKKQVLKLREKKGDGRKKVERFMVGVKGRRD